MDTKQLNKLAKSMGFMFDGHSSNGHSKYFWFSQDGVEHIVVGPGRHSRVHETDGHRLRQRINKCKQGKCIHSRLGT